MKSASSGRSFRIVFAIISQFIFARTVLAVISSGCFGGDELKRTVGVYTHLSDFLIYS